MLVVDIVKFAWAHPYVAVLIIVSIWVAYKVTLRRWRTHRALTAARLEKRRAAGIPDSDSRPWLIARPAAELRRVEEVARLRAEREAAAEKKRLEERREEINEWGHKAVKTLQRLHSSGELTRQSSGSRRRVDRRTEDEDEFYANEPLATAPTWARSSPARPHVALPPPSPRETPSRTRSASRIGPTIRSSSKSMPSGVPRQSSRLPSGRPRVQKRGRGDSDSEEEEQVRPRKATARGHGRHEEQDDEEMFSDSDLESEDFDAIEEDEREMLDEEAADDGMMIDERPLVRKTSRAKRSRQENDEPRKRPRKSEQPEVSDTLDAEMSDDSRSSSPKPDLPLRSDVGAPDDLPVYGSSIASFEGGERWTDASGVKWFRSATGIVYRQEEIRVSTLKYKMPRDSEHPDARTETGDFTRMWIEEDQYKRLKSEGRLKWQDSPHASPASAPRRDKGKAREEYVPPSRPSSVISSVAQRSLSRSTAGGRIGLANSVISPRSGSTTSSPASRPDSPYYTNVAALDRQLASPARSRLNSPAPRRQLSEAGQAKRHAEILAKLGYDKDDETQETPAAATPPHAGAAPSLFKTATPEKSASPSPAPFSFGTKGTAPVAPSPLSKETAASPVSTASTSAPLEKATDKSSEKPASTFSFNTPTPTDDGKAVEKSSTPASLPTPAPAKTAGKSFSFGPSAASVEKAADKPAETPVSKPFSFGPPTAAAPAPAAPAAAKSFSFGTPATAEAETHTAKPIGATSEAQQPSAKPFSFGAPPKPEAEKPAAKQFSFGAPTAPADKKEEAVAPKSFSFGTSSAAPPAVTTASASTGFSFGAPKESPALGAAAGGFQFGAPKESPSLGAPKESPALGASTGSFFGAPKESPALDTSSGGFSFGGPKESPALGASSSGFSFGTTSSTTTTPPASTTTGFSFGESAAPNATTASNNTSFSFGKPSDSKPASTFGSTTQPAPAPASTSSFSFGTAPATTPSATPGSFSFGGATNSGPPASSTGFSFGNSGPASPALPGPSFAFGSTTPSATQATAPPAASFSFGAPSPSRGFSFGATPDPAEGGGRPISRLRRGAK